MINRYQLSVNLEKILKKQGMKQCELARKSQLSDTTISQYIHMKANATETSVRKIADALGVSCEYLGMTEDE